MHSTDSLLLLQLAPSGVVLHHMTLLATVITNIRPHFVLPNMEIATCVALDTFGLFFGLTVLALPVVLPFLILPLEIPLLLVVLPVQVLGLFVLVLT